MRWLLTITLSIFVASSWASEAYLERLDHFYAVSPEAEKLLEFFSHDLQLPLAWPYRSYQSFASGAVTFGNVAFEVARFPSTTSNDRTDFRGIAFLPSAHAPEVRTQYESAGVELGESRPFVTSTDGVEQVLWENMTFTRLSSTSMTVFICDYKNRDLINAGRQRASGELAARGGGPLGIIELAQIEIDAPDQQQVHADWSHVLRVGPDDLLAVSSQQPSIRINHGEKGISSITLRVHSLAAARSWLDAKEMLGSTTTESVQISPGAVQGLGIWLVE